MRWDKLYLHKSLGGFGFMIRKPLIKFLSLVKKVGNSLTTCILKYKYFYSKGFLGAQYHATIQVIHREVYGVPKTLSNWAVDGRFVIYLY